jgi:hypothetical protein
MSDADTEEVLEQIVQAIVRDVDPEEIWLFRLRTWMDGRGR